MRQHVMMFVLAAGLAGAGCVATVHGTATATADGEVIEEEPPPPREEVVEVRPGFVFIQGNWYRSGGRWEWRAGRWERERVGHRWAPGRWERRGRGRVWVEGRWEAGGTGTSEGGVQVRDHR